MRIYPLTKPQQKVLARIRSIGQVRGASLTTYQYRSLDRLEREGLIRVVPCNTCWTCREHKGNCLNPVIVA